MRKREKVSYPNFFNSPVTHSEGKLEEDPPRRLKFMDEVFQPLKPTKWVTEVQYIQRLKRKKAKKDNRFDEGPEDDESAH